VGGTAVWSFAGAKVPRRAMLAISTSGVIGMAITLASINHGGSRAWFVPCALSIAVQGGMTPASLGLIGDLTASRDGSRGTAMGFFSLLMGLGQMLGGLIGGPFVARWQLDGLLILDAILGCLALSAMPWIRTREIRPHAK
jgi:predicted MFS family arabinose efflux permease